MTTWVKGKLGDIAIIKMGQSPPGDSCVTQDGSPLLNGPTEFGSHHPTPVQFTSQPKRFARKNDLLFCVRGSTTGRMNWANRDYAIGRGIAAIRHKEASELNFYVRYLIENKLSGLLAQATGSTFPNLSREQLENIQILLPSLETQFSINSILISYDELIENNEKRIKILEEIVQLIYKEWFVKFKFPGHEKVSMIDSLLGRIPLGWKIGKLNDLVKNTKISTKPGAHLKNRKYVPIDCIDSKELLINKSELSDLAKSSLVLFESGDILFGAMRPYFHKVAISFFPGVTRSTCLVLRPKYHLYFSALTLFSNETVDFASSHTQGSTIPYVNWENVLENKVCIIPEGNILGKFESLVSLIMNEAEILNSQKIILAKMRDLLIPQLITGKRELKN